ncbi:MAG TPA: glycosyltransferase family 87 protein, partial [Acidimicrobiia bacterium]|nr:glycosyltransferase family 87 protein [Acidimicrobiia bacterium]
MDRDESHGRALAIGAAVIIVAGVGAAFWMLHPFHRKFDLIDLAVYRAAGKAVLHGHSVFGGYVGQQLRVRLPFIYPPFSAVLAIPFTLMGQTLASFVWTAVTLGLLLGVVRYSVEPLSEKYGTPLAVGIGLLAALALSPVQENLRFGQLGIALMACCVFDCMMPRTRWPRGALIGVATAVKLVPGIFIVYLFFTKRVRASAVAVATFAACTFIGLCADFSDSVDFFTSRMFKPTSPKYFSNQSLEGMLERATSLWRLPWLPIAAFVFVYGMWHATRASRQGDELRGVAITGLV